MFPFSDDSAAITDDFNGHKSGRTTHNAWDVGAQLGSGIVAPESGRLLFLYMPRAGQPLPEAGVVPLPDELSAFSWYFADRYGGCVILLGGTWWWLFSHVPATELFRQATMRNLEMGFIKWRNDSDASQFVEVYSNVKDKPLPSVNEGSMIGLVGDSGYSTAPHCHMEIYPPGGGGYTDRIDPAQLYPDEYASRLVT